MSGDGRRVTLEGADASKPIAVALAGGEGLVGLQAQRDRAQLLRLGGGPGAAELCASGRAASDWVDVSDGRWGLTVGLQDMWEMSPQAIEVRPDGMAIHFYPPFVAAWDSRGAAFSSRIAGAFTGISRTHDLVLAFHAGGADAARQRAIARHFTRQPYAHASSWWICSTGAVGLCHAYDPEAFSAVEGKIRHQLLSTRWNMMLRLGARVTCALFAKAQSGSAADVTRPETLRRVYSSWLWRAERGQRSEDLTASKDFFARLADAIKEHGGEFPYGKFTRKPFGFADFDGYGASSAAMALHLHTGDPRVCEVIRAYSRLACSGDAAKRGGYAGVARTAATFWLDGPDEDGRRLALLRKHLEAPQFGGAYWHGTMSEMHALPATMAALAKQGASGDRTPVEPAGK
jgi:hypothetical protein